MALVQDIDFGDLQLQLQLEVCCNFIQSYLEFVAQGVKVTSTGQSTLHIWLVPTVVLHNIMVCTVGTNQNLQYLP